MGPKLFGSDSEHLVNSPGMPPNLQDSVCPKHLDNTSKLYKHLINYLYENNLRTWRVKFWNNTNAPKSCILNYKTNVISRINSVISISSFFAIKQNIKN